MDRGRVIANDTPMNLKSLGSTVIEFRMVDEPAATRAAIILAPVVRGLVEQDGCSVHFTSNDGTRVLVEALHALDAQDLDPKELEVREPSLDDVFLLLTDRHHPEDVASATLTALVATGAR